MNPHPRKVILEEDYVTSITEIIRRDYFPSNAPSHTSLVLHSTSLALINPESDTEKPLSLTEFHEGNMSEDNYHFHEQHSADIEKHRTMHAYAYDDSNGKNLLLLPDGTKMTHERMIGMEASPLASDGFMRGSNEIKTWRFQAKNNLMFIPSVCPAVGVNQEEQILRIGHSTNSRTGSIINDLMPPPPPRRVKPPSSKGSIQPTATRFPPGELLNQFLSSSKTRNGTGTKINNNNSSNEYEQSHTASEYSCDDTCSTRSSRSNNNNFTYVPMTPVINPGDIRRGDVNASPIITYGTISGTPVTLVRYSEPLSRPGFEVGKKEEKKRKKHNGVGTVVSNERTPLFPAGGSNASGSGGEGGNGEKRKKRKGVEMSPAAKVLLSRMNGGNSSSSSSIFSSSNSYSASSAASISARSPSALRASLLNSSASAKRSSNSSSSRSSTMRSTPSSSAVGSSTRRDGNNNTPIAKARG